MAAESLKRLPFDLYGRYRLAADVASRVAARRVLDVGGGPGVLDAFCEDAETVAVDVRVPRLHEPAPRLVVADGALMPFPDDAFDLVVILDTLEHVDGPHRRPLLVEAARVSRGWLLVAGPCATPGVAEADAALLSFVRAKFGEDFETVGTLTEHLAVGHPDPDELDRWLQGTAAEVARFPSGRLDRWLPMMLLFHELMALGRDDPVERVQAWYNDLFYRDDFRDPAYRQAFLARLPDAGGPTAEEVVGRVVAPDDAPLGASGFEALQALLASSLADAEASHALQVADLEARLTHAERRVAELAERAQSAEDHVRVLLAFRDRVLSHPAVRARRALRRPLRW